MARIGVVLCGCGHLDGSEIHEATLTLLRLDERGAETVCFAPGRKALMVMDHLARRPAGEQRFCLQEAARIARGRVAPLSEAKAEQLDGLIVPGGQGAAKNLCNWFEVGSAAAADPDAARLIAALHAAGKPQGFICIAPVLAALVLGRHGVRLSIGNDAATAREIEKTGARHVVTAVDEVCVDEANRLVSTPAYMLGPSVAPIYRGVARLVDRVVDWCA